MIRVPFRQLVRAELVQLVDGERDVECLSGDLLVDESGTVNPKPRS